MPYDPNQTKPNKKYEVHIRNYSLSNQDNDNSEVNLGKLRVRDYDFPNEERSEQEQSKTQEAAKPKFGFGSFALLLALLWISDWIGAAFPGPIDDLIYDLIGALFFGLVQQLRSILANKK